MSLPAPRVTITTHTADGKSTLLESSKMIEPFHPFGPQASGFSMLHTTETVPASNNERSPSTPVTSSIPRAPAGGVAMVTTDIPPGGSAPMHRTVSLDYAVVLAGEIVLGLEDGQTVCVKAGEMVVQRGTLHSWTNEGHVPCRILFVLIGADKVVVENGGARLDAVMPGHPDRPETGR